MKDFVKVRIGIDRPADKSHASVSKHVLEKFSRHETDVLYSHVFPRLSRELLVRMACRDLQNHAEFVKPLSNLNALLLRQMSNLPIQQS
jgi:peptidyl-tRNA hydrolase